MLKYSDNAATAVPLCRLFIASTCCCLLVLVDSCIPTFGGDTLNRSAKLGISHVVLLALG